MNGCYLTILKFYQSVFKSVLSIISDLIFIDLFTLPVYCFITNEEHEPEVNR